MAKAAATGHDLSLVLSLLVLLSCLRTTLAADTHSLSCNVIVRAYTTPPQPWCEGQCSVDGVPFLQYDNNNKAMPLGDLGKEVDATITWTELTESLKDISEELRKQLLNMQPVADKTRDPHTLQVTTASRYKREQFVHASWNFTISEQYSFHFYPINKTWGVTHDKARGTMKQWKTNRELVRGLRKFSLGDSRHSLKEFLTHWKEMPRPISRAPDIIYLPPTIDATPHPSTRQFPNNRETINTAVVISIIIIILIVICICMCVKRKCCPQGGAPCRSSSSSSAVSGDSRILPAASSAKQTNVFPMISWKPGPVTSDQTVGNSENDGPQRLTHQGI